jgi:hypothetical protein
MQIEASPLPHWTELSRAERLQLFATFPAPEARMPVPSVRAPLHLTLAGQMGPAGVDEVQELPQLLKLAFGDEESMRKLRSGRHTHSDWEQRFVKRYLRFIANQQTGGFFEPWHNGFSPGNAYISRITDEKALAAVEKAYREADRELLLERILLHPAYIAVWEWTHLPPGIMVMTGAANYRFDALFSGAIATDELRKWCAFYYFRVYGEKQTIAEGLIIAPNPEAVITHELVVRVQSLEEVPCPKAIVTLQNESYGYLRTQECSDEGTARFTSVPTYVYESVRYDVICAERYYADVEPVIRTPPENGVIEMEFTLD